MAGDTTRVAGRLVLVGIGLVLGLGMAELLLRLFPSMMPAAAREWTALYPEADGETEEEGRGTSLKLMIEHPELRYLPASQVSVIEHSEYTFTLDTSHLVFGEVGFRDDGIDGQPYAVAVGDSFVMGWGVELEETWVELLEARTGRDIANMGVMGSGTRKETSVLTTYGLTLQPELVLYGFFPNDVEDQAWQIEVVEAGATEDPLGLLQGQMEQQHPFYRIRSFLSHNSYLYRLLGYLYYASQGEVCTYRDGQLNYTFDIAGWRRRLDFDDPSIAEAMEAVLQDLEEAYRATQESGAEFVLLIFPAKEQIYLDIITQHCAHSLPPDQFDPLMQRLDSFCQSEGIRCVDLGEAMLAAGAATRQIYYSMDGHWNAEGNRLAADLIYEYLEESGLLSE